MIDPNKEMEETYKWSIEDLPESVFTEEAFDRVEKNRKDEAKLMEEEQAQLREDRYNLRYQLFRKLRELKDKTVLCANHSPCFISFHKK